MEELAHKHKPKLIIAGGSAYVREWDYKRIRGADCVGAIFMVNMAHPAGLILTGSWIISEICTRGLLLRTKTLRGPRGGVILVGKDFENPLGQDC